MSPSYFLDRPLVLDAFPNSVLAGFGPAFSRFYPSKQSNRRSASTSAS